MTNDKTPVAQPETLPDVRPELAAMGRGSMQRRITELEGLLWRAYEYVPGRDDLANEISRALAAYRGSE